MASGFFLGGVAQGAQQAQQLGIQQQQATNSLSLGTKALQLQEQQQKNAQQRELYARADKDRTNLMNIAGETIKELKLRGIPNDQIAKAVQPLVQQAKQLAQGSGVDPSTIDAQVAATLALPSYDPNAVTGTGSGASPAAAAPQAAAAPAAAPMAGAVPAAPAAPGADVNLTGPGKTITGVDYGQATDGQGNPVAAPAATPAPMAGASPAAPAPAAAAPQSDVNRLTTALMTLPSYAPASMKQAITLRLQEAVKQQDQNVEVKVLKDENSNDHVVFIDKKNRKVTDQNGQPYVVPGGQGGEASDSNVIADAIASGKQPPVLTGLYKNGKAVRAALARKGIDLSQMQLEWDSAHKQVLSLNGPQMVRYAGLAKSVVNTIDEVKSLSQELQNSGVPLLNRAKLATFMQTAGNTPNGQLAARYFASVNTLKEEFANLAQGGYAPTEAAWTLANQQINGDYGVKQLDAALNEVQRLIRYRLNGIPNFTRLGPDASNRYVGGGQPQAPAAAGAGSAAPAKQQDRIPPPPPGFVIVNPGQ